MSPMPRRTSAPPASMRTLAPTWLEPAQAARRPQSPDRLEEHVAHAEQGARPARVHDDPRVHLAGDGKGDAAGDVRLDHAGNDVHARPLGGDHEVYPHRERTR